MDMGDSTVINNKEGNNDLKFTNFYDFAKNYPLYTRNLMITYKIFVDLAILQEYSNLSIIDGTIYGIESYCFRGMIKNKKDKYRVLIPIRGEGSINLTW